MRHRSLSTGAGGDNGIAKLWTRREISVCSYHEMACYLLLHPYVLPAATCYRAEPHRVVSARGALRVLYAMSGTRRARAT
eukprot:COSAG01_NODE_6166_length_3814_cov_46.365276_5_plen_80_part_00